MILLRRYEIRVFFAVLLLLNVFSCATTHVERHEFVTIEQLSITQDPADLYNGLFKQIQLMPLFADSKYFVDMLPHATPEAINSAYQETKPANKAELAAFVARYFLPPLNPTTNFTGTAAVDVNQHIKELWRHLSRAPDEFQPPGSSLIRLPYPYVVPGGRFREIYYWDSYFTQLGLLADHEDALFTGMVKNFEYFLLTMGRIPNGNRTYYRGRSQPPFFSHMVALWRHRFGVESALQFLPALIREHEFWMNGAKGLNVGEAAARVVRIAETGYLNRYWDDVAAPRPEAYKEDVALARQAAAHERRSADDVYRDLRAGAESGWDYSSRWFGKSRKFVTIHTTDFIPIDLNSLLYHLELTISNLAKFKGDHDKAKEFAALALQRRQLIHQFLWSETIGAFGDYDWRTRSLSPETTVATAVPLFTGVATPAEAARVARVLRERLLKPGGLVTTQHATGQQWDAPNGWPPHQWMAYAGLMLYGEKTLAEGIRQRWLRLNRKVFQATGKLVEKYNVINIHLKSGGGEYPLQDGFGWTNGVFRALETPDESLRHLREFTH